MMAVIDKQIYNFKEIEQLPPLEKKKYYKAIRTRCAELDARTGNSFLTHLITTMSPILRSFPVEIRGVENLLQDEATVFVCNHSNSHDIFLAMEVFKKIGRQVSVLVAQDGLSPLSHLAFEMGNATFIERTVAQSKQDGIFELCAKVMNGTNVFIFGEATWNLHPLLPMQRIKAGTALISAITNRPVIPVVFEYLEVPKPCKKERNLYKKCIVCFEKPISIDEQDSLFQKTRIIQSAMEQMRKALWEEFGTQHTSLQMVDANLYINHLYLKKYKALGFTYNSAYETQFLLNKENEYCLNGKGELVPGILEK